MYEPYLSLLALIPHSLVCLERRLVRLSFFSWGELGAGLKTCTITMHPKSSKLNITTRVIYRISVQRDCVLIVYFILQRIFRSYVEATTSVVLFAALFFIECPPALCVGVALLLLSPLFSSLFNFHFPLGLRFCEKSDPSRTRTSLRFFSVSHLFSVFQFAPTPHLEFRLDIIVSDSKLLDYL